MNLIEFLKSIKTIKNELIPQYTYLIEPNEPVESTEDILKEVYNYFNNQGKDIFTIEKNPLPVLSIDGEIYIARTDRFFGLLRLGSKVDSPFPIRYYGGSLGNIAGFKFIYIYPYDLSKQR
jgi:hypothetical protein